MCGTSIWNAESFNMHFVIPGPTVISGAEMLAYLLARIHPSAGPLKRWFDACTEENGKRLMNLTYICKGRNIVRRRPRWNV